MNAEQNRLPLPGRDFAEKFVEADGFNIRYMDAGSGEAVVYLHGAGGLRLSHAHDLLAQNYRVIALEAPGFGDSAVNDKSETLNQMADSIAAAIAAIGVERYHLIGNSFGGKLAILTALQHTDAIETLVLVAPAAIRLTTSGPPSGTPAEMMAMLYAHPERQPKMTPPTPEVLAKQGALVKRLIGPPRDEAMETAMKDLDIPVLAVFGTKDKLITTDVAHIYAELLPNCHLMMIYDAAHAVDADRPEATAEVIADFLARKEKFLVKQGDGIIHP